MNRELPTWTWGRSGTALLATFGWLLACGGDGLATSSESHRTLAEDTAAREDAANPTDAAMRDSGMAASEDAGRDLEPVVPTRLRCESQQTELDCLSVRFPNSLEECRWEEVLRLEGVNVACEDAVKLGRCVYLPPGGPGGCGLGCGGGGRVFGLFRRFGAAVEVFVGGPYVCGIFPQQWHQCQVQQNGSFDQNDDPACGCLSCPSQDASPDAL